MTAFIQFLLLLLFTLGVLTLFTQFFARRVDAYFRPRGQWLEVAGERIREHVDVGVVRRGDDHGVAQPARQQGTMVLEHGHLLPGCLGARGPRVGIGVRHRGDHGAVEGRLAWLGGDRGRGPRATCRCGQTPVSARNDD